jgi:hypothetical protein
MAGTLIQPLKINRPSGRAVPQLNIAADFGVERNAATKIEELFQKKQKQDLIQAETFGQQFAASMSKMILDRDNQGKINKKLFHNFDSYNSLESEIKSNIEQFKKDGKELGIDDSILEKYSSMVTGELEKSNVNYLVEYNDYNEKIQKDEATRIIRMKGDNLSSVAMLGDYQGAVQGFYNVAQDLDRAIEAGYIDIEKGINLATKQRQDIIVSYIASLVNTPNGKSKLQNMNTWATTQFMEAFQDLNFKNDMGEFYLGIDDYESFKKAIASGLRSIENKEKLNNQNTMVERLKYEQKKKTNPLELSLKEDQVAADGYIPESTMVKAINYKNGVTVTGVNEAINLGYSIPWKEKGLNDTTEVYKNPNLAGEGVMNFRQQEAELMANGYGYEAVKNFYDTTDENIIGGSMLMETYQMNTTFKDEFDKVYSSDNRKILANFDKVQITDFSTLKEYNTEFQGVDDPYYATPTSFMSGQVSRKPQKTMSIAAGGKIAGLQVAANNGSLAATRATKDITQIATDTLILELYSKYGGVITDDLADKGGLKEKYVGQPIASLTPEQQRTFLKGVLENDKSIRETVNSRVENVVNAMTEGLDTINLGNNRVIFAPKIIKEDERTNFITGQIDRGFVVKERDIEKTQKAINEMIAKNTYKVNYNGTIKEIGDKKNITFVQDIGSTKVRLFYGGQPVFTDNGYAVFDVEEFIKEE